MADAGDKIVRLTGQPVSSGMKSVLDRLANGERVSIEDIEKTSEIQTARTCISNSAPTILLKNREMIQGNVYNRLNEKGSAVIDEKGNIEYNGIVEQGSRLDIVIGLPGSGKSSTIVDTISQEFHARVIDNDEAKKHIPEYNNGWGAGVVHKESQAISRKLLESAYINHDNIVLSKVGSNSAKMEAIIHAARLEGYQVYVHYVELDRNKALGRMLDRFIETGRFLEPELIDGYCNENDGNKIEQCYEELKKGGILDGYSKWNNDVEKGERPVLIEAECRGEFIREARAAGDISGYLRDYGERRSGGLQSEPVRASESPAVESDVSRGEISEDRPDILSDCAGSRNEVRIIADIEKNGFKPVQKLVKSICYFEQLEGRAYTLHELAELKQRHPQFNGHLEKKECFERIIAEFQTQEKQMSHGERHDIAQTQDAAVETGSFLKQEMLMEQMQMTPV